MDGLTLWAVTAELQQLIDGKIEKIQQPEQDTLLLTVRKGGGNYKLLLCAHPENGRVQLTNAAFVNPAEPPMFCMLLRKRLHGARIKAVVQKNLDRTLMLLLEARDELFDLVELRIMVELMGKYSNICLVNQADVLLDCIRHVGANMSSVRILLPGVRYEEPPSQDKTDPRLMSGEDFLKALDGRGSLHKLLSGQFFGLSPQCAKQLIGRFFGSDDISAETLTLAEKQAFARYIGNVYAAFSEGRFTPTVVYNAAREPVAVYPFAPHLPEEACASYPGMSTALDAFYAERDVVTRFKRQSGSLQKKLSNFLERSYKKLAVYETARNQGDDLEKQRLYGELLSAGAHAVERGAKAARVLNYYNDPPIEIIIPLDEKLSPQMNAQRFFKRYQKGKAAKALAERQVEETQADIAYLEGQLYNLDKCRTDGELNEIREELVREGYIRPEMKKRFQLKKQQASQPVSFRASDGTEIYVGRNNQQNDYLTLRFARAEDWWFHTKSIPGSHVILRTEAEEPPQKALLEAAMLAACFSKAKASASVPVDYCKRKYVKKPAGAKPGMVIYTTNRTLYVTPDEALVKKLEATE